MGVGPGAALCAVGAASPEPGILSACSWTRADNEPLCRGPGGVPSTGRQPDTPLLNLFTITPALWPNDS